MSCVSRIPERGSSSPLESSPSRSSEGPSLLSAEARKERDRKHLDDITAAKLPPLHHTPARLLTLEESASLLKEQTKKQQVPFSHCSHAGRNNHSSTLMGGRGGAGFTVSLHSTTVEAIYAHIFLNFFCQPTYYLHLFYVV